MNLQPPKITTRLYIFGVFGAVLPYLATQGLISGEDIFYLLAIIAAVLAVPYLPPDPPKK